MAFAKLRRITSTWSFPDRSLLAMPWMVTVDLLFLNPYYLSVKILDVAVNNKFQSLAGYRG